MSDNHRRKPLKDLGINAIESAIKKAIYELTGEEYKTDIITINFEPYKDTDPHPKNCFELKVRLQKNMDFSFLEKQD